MLEKRGNDEEYWHWEQKGGGEGGASLIDGEMRRGRGDEDSTCRGRKEVKGEEAAAKSKRSAPERYS